MHVRPAVVFVRRILNSSLACCGRTILLPGLLWGLFTCACSGTTPHAMAQADKLADTEQLNWEGDIASRMIDGVTTFLDEQSDQLRQSRIAYWDDQLRKVADQEAFLDERRAEFALLIGLRDERVVGETPWRVSAIEKPELLAECDSLDFCTIRWRTIGAIVAEAIMIEPRGESVTRTVILLPDADTHPAQLAWGDSDGGREPLGALLAATGCRVIIPHTLSRTVTNRRAQLSHREFIYRSAFELGRHVFGYEVQQVLALVDHFGEGEKDSVVVAGYGDGGAVALFAAAIDRRIDGVCVSGYFDRRDGRWEQPIDRTIFNQLNRFSDAELVLLASHGSVIIDAVKGPELRLAGNGGAPAVLESPKPKDVNDEFQRAESLWEQWDRSSVLSLINANAEKVGCSRPALQALLDSVWADAPDIPAQPPTIRPHHEFDRIADQQRLIRLYDEHNQDVLRDCAAVRTDFMSQLDSSSLEAFKASQAAYRQAFREDVIGQFEVGRHATNPRSRVAYREAKWTGYEVVLDVCPNVFAYGILLVPNDLQEGERRPVVVCQHGLEGRPQDVVAGDHRAYHDFAAKLAERGFITFAPQNIYIFGDRFRSLQRRAYPLGKTLFSVMVPQHQTIVDWLGTLPYVDPDRIAFYGLSYGGKSAMRIPALVEDYCLSICSADFNEWVWKNASTHSPYSYVWTGEYEIFEWNLGNTFNYAEMAALIAPRPFMVERGHFDGVAPDETVAFEFAKVRHLYAAKLGLPQRCEIEWFAGPHTIHGQGTFSFLHRHLNWPTPRSDRSSP